MQPAADIAPGFDDSVHGAQQVFRAVLAALSRPGTLQLLTGLPGAPLPPTLAAAALMLLDHDTPVWLSPSLRTDAVRRFLAFHAGAPVTLTPSDAAFVLCAAPQEAPELDALSQGTPDYPDASATLLIAVAGFEAGETVTLSGPGIETEQSFRAAGLDADFWQSARRNAARYPLGVDFLFCGPDTVAGLPRSTRIAE
jgi:alpha-D-ribose 1-methylphosphonate 5-triphosphate synthase subunit PhnH